ncbi:MAG: transketolase C-terminal domain-containing protein [Rectinemataceae bacterium]|jgi:transketolase
MSSAGFGCRQAFARALLDEARRDPSIFVVTSDARGSAALDEFARELPEQFVEVGIAEQDAVGVGAGLARSGKRVFVAGPASFYSARCVEQVKNDVAYADLDVKIVGVSGGVSYGALGATHHSLCDIALYRAVPNMSVIIPSDAAQAELVARHLARNRGPAYVRMGRSPVPDSYEPGAAAFSSGKANILAQGSDCAIVACGEALHYALGAVSELAARGIACLLLDMPSIKPLDEAAILEAARRCGAVVTVEEHYACGGLGGAVAELLSQRLPTPLRILGFPDEYLPAGSSDELFEYCGLGSGGIAGSVVEFLGATRKGAVT